MKLRGNNNPSHPRPAHGAYRPFCLLSHTAVGEIAGFACSPPIHLQLQSICGGLDCVTHHSVGTFLGSSHLWDECLPSTGIDDFLLSLRGISLHI